MTTKYKEEIRRYLQQQLEHLSAVGGEGVSLETCADNNDFATLLTQHNLEMALRARRSVQLAALERALRRLDLDDDYGVCLECGEDIGLARIKANPAADLCVHCQAEAERALKACA
ncbi:TraR/DksA family transcriptional regulator [Paucidesulfovibrio longus]|uniref:TraR/DksA family transcriptional regulator n=1 Tax=Paucidesulfovibrio longus TaxID=889 RepID=UPI0003B42ADC|nr:TraR/DksA C4-type zinc finger protein [Paucidesulfovibrio longus]